MLISPRDLVSLQSVGLNVTVLLWTLGVSLLTGIIFGLAPALHISRLNLNDSLKEGGKSESARRAAAVDCAARSSFLKLRWRWCCWRVPDC